MQPNEIVEVVETEEVDLKATCLSLVDRLRRELSEDNHAEECFHEIEEQVGNAVGLIGNVLASDDAKSELGGLLKTLFTDEP